MSSRKRSRALVGAIDQHVGGGALLLSSALLVDADLVMTYDGRLALACEENGLAVAKPGVDA